MLRTTITKIKRVCVLAFIPRILRGNIRHVPGPFEKLTISPIRSLKHTGPESEEERCRICEKCRRLIEMAFGPEKSTDDTKAETIIATVVHEPDITQELQTEKLTQMVAPQIQVKLEAESDKCGRMIEQVFGTTDKENKKDLAENVTSLPLEDMRLQSAPVRKNLKESQETEILQRPPNNPTELPNLDVNLLIAMKRNVNAYDNPIENTCDANNNNVYATTAKEDEDKLIQKLEHIDDDPLVEAPRAKIEGFNDSPKVLGQSATQNFARKVDGYRKGTSEADSYDAIASSCLNTPNKQIDERLLKELEKLGVPQPGAKAAKEPILENELVQMDVLKKPRKPVKKTEIDLETREFEREPPECYKLEKIQPPFATFGKYSSTCYREDGSTEKLEKLVEHFERNLVSFDEIYTKTAQLLKTTCMQQSDSSNNQSYTNLISGPKPPMDPNRVLIDPYDKKTIARDTGEYDFRDLSNLLYYDYVKPQDNKSAGKETVGTEVYTETTSQNESYLHPTRFRPILTPDDLRIVGRNYNQEYSPTEQQFSQYHAQNYQGLHGQGTNEVQNQENAEVSPQDEKAETATNNDVMMSIETAPLINTDPSEKSPLHTEVEGIAHGAYPAKDQRANEQTPYQPAHMFHTPATRHQQAYMVHQAYASQYPYHAESYYNANRHNIEDAYAHSSVNNLEEAHKPEQFKSVNAFTSNQDKQIHLEEAGNEYNPDLDAQTARESVNEIEPETIKLELSVGPEDVKEAEILSNEVNDQQVEVQRKIGLHQRMKEMRARQQNHDYSLSFLQSKGMVNPLPKQEEPPLQNVTAALDQLPKQDMNDSEVKVSLSELLRRVRERNRLELYQELNSLVFSSQATEVEPIVGKCGKKPPPCPPPAPKCPPPEPCPPKPCPPPPPPCPKPCKPKCPPPCPPKDPCAKFNNIRDTITLLFVSDHHDNSQITDMFVCDPSNKGIDNDDVLLSEDVMTRLQSYAEALIAKSYVSKSECTFDRRAVTNGMGFRYARDYTPWTPIPSWQVPKKEKKEPFVCPKEGCKLFPPPRSDPPCLEKPCTGFPRRTYSLVDFFTLYLAENQVYDIGE